MRDHDCLDPEFVVTSWEPAEEPQGRLAPRLEPVANHLVRKDDVPFLIVNATLRQVESMVDGFGDEADWSIDPYWH